MFSRVVGLSIVDVHRTHQNRFGAAVHAMFLVATCTHARASNVVPHTHTHTHTHTRTVLAFPVCIMHNFRPCLQPAVLTYMYVNLCRYLSGHVHVKVASGGLYTTSHTHTHTCNAHTHTLATHTHTCNTHTHIHTHTHTHTLATHTGCIRVQHLLLCCLFQQDPRVYLKGAHPPPR